ncbi:MAG: HD domain-containing protein [Lachnospiraceae bacterium]|nr:HD domain-containing protein [Lachnospiraceae bacterium]
MKSNQYNNLSQELQEQILDDRKAGWINPIRTRDEDVVRRRPSHDKSNLWRPAYVRDAEKILHLPFYNRYADKTQVFSFYHNDDITRRGLHVQLVSRIARNIGAVLGLNLDLIEAIALGHDIGHTPFGHAGERFLDELLFDHAGLHFNHNIQSARVLDVLFARNVSLQTLDGIISHNGELPQTCYRPTNNKSFAVFDQSVQACYKDGEANDKLTPATPEGCVMRISDIIAYLGKDRQDAEIARIIPSDYRFHSKYIGESNAPIINNLIVDIIENSYRKDYIAMSPEVYQDLMDAKDENSSVIYQAPKVKEKYDSTIKPMFEDVYERLLGDLKAGNEDSLIYRHHIRLVEKNQKHYMPTPQYRHENPDLIVADYIASMTDDYFLALYEKLFPESRHKIEFHSYFD